MRRWQDWLWVGFCLVAIPATHAAADQFILQIPGSQQEPSSAVLKGGRLTVTDAGGDEYVYERHPAVDSDTPAGRFQGYYCRQADQYLLWPASGSGAMIIGTPAAGGKIAWRKSRMEVRRTTPGLEPAAAAGAPKPIGPAHAAVLARSGDSVPLVIARINAAGRIEFYTNTPAGWRYGQSRLASPLLPGAPLALDRDPGRNAPVAGRPIVYTVSPAGHLVKVVDGTKVVRLPLPDDPPQFRPGAHLAPSGPDGDFFATDERGLLWCLRPSGADHRIVDPKAGRFVPGCPVAALHGRAFAIDDRGRLVHLDATPPKTRPGPRSVALADGFVPGGGVATWSHTAGTREEDGRMVDWVASVDGGGAIHVFWHSGGSWSRESIDGARLPPGAPLSLTARGNEVSLTAVRGDGTWTEWRRRGRAWTARPIAAGFPLGAPIVALGLDGALVAVDATGRIVVATFGDGLWRLEVVAPPRGFVPRFPQLLSRAVEPRPPLAPATVNLQNSHSEPLRLRIADARNPLRPVELSIPPGGALSHRFDRDAGAELVEVYLVPGPDGGMVRQEQRWPIAPRQIYTVAVYADRVTSRYVDRRPPGVKSPHALPDSETRSAVSLGVFPIPPGELLEPDSRLDVYREAKARNNPGAAAWFGPP